MYDPLTARKKALKAFEKASNVTDYENINIRILSAIFYSLIYIGDSINHNYNERKENG